MAAYAFVTIWRLEAPIDAVYEQIRDSLAWPDWWKAVTAVSDVHVADTPNGVGSVRRYTFKGALPYSLAFDLRVTEVEPPARLAGQASGELEGTGLWTLHEADGVTTVRYDWKIRTTRWWMNLLAPVAGGVFKSNHDFVMRSGLDGIRQRLGVRGWEVDPRSEAASASASA
jgi:hypothetical protein